MDCTRLPVPPSHSRTWSRNASSKWGLVTQKPRLKRKVFFFEKKKQKTFIALSVKWRTVRDSDQTFFGSRRAGFRLFSKMTIF